MLIIIGNDILSKWIIIAYFGVTLFLISLSFVLMLLRVDLGIVALFVLVIADILILVISLLIVQFVLSFSTYSSNYIQMAKRNARTKLEAKLLKSYQPIRVSVGRFFTFESKNFCLQMYGRVILETTISLLLTFRNKNWWLGRLHFNFNNF